MFDTMFDRNIFGSSSEVFGKLRKSSGIFEKSLPKNEINNRKRIEYKQNYDNFIVISLTSIMFDTMFEHLRIILGSLRETSEIFGKFVKTSLLVCL